MNRIIHSWLERRFRNDVKTHLERTKHLPSGILTDKDLEHLPPPVQQYLRVSGVVNKPVASNMRVVFEGEMRNKGKEFFPFVSEQYNFFDEPTRLFFMKARMFGITVPGYHCYNKGKATMDIRLFGIIPLIRESGAVMDKTETVTLFNDMCLLAPASLIDRRITWQPVDCSRVKATFTNGDISITATLFFDELGRLVNFISHDRTAISDMKDYPFSTPVHEWNTIDGRQIVSHGDAIWHYPDGEFTYGRFFLREIEYNCLSKM